MAVYGLVKRDFVAPSSGGGIPKRIKEIRRALGPWKGKLLPREQLAERVGVHASTIKKWETGDVTDLSSDNALKLAAVAGCDVDWILSGRGRPPKVAAEPASRPQGRPAAGQGTPGAESPPGARGGRSTASGPAAPLSPDEIAEEVSNVLAPLIEQLANKGPHVAANWLLVAAAEASHQTVPDVKPLIDLARDFLWRARVS